MFTGTGRFPRNENVRVRSRPLSFPFFFSGRIMVETRTPLPPPFPNPSAYTPAGFPFFPPPPPPPQTGEQRQPARHPSFFPPLGITPTQGSLSPSSLPGSDSVGKGAHTFSQNGDIAFSFPLLPPFLRSDGRAHHRASVLLFFPHHFRSQRFA